MKTADARLIALALFALALALPVAAWIQRGHAAETPPAASNQERVWDEPTVPAFQIIETKQGVLRLSTGNGATEILINKQWHDLPGKE